MKKYASLFLMAVFLTAGYRLLSVDTVKGQEATDSAAQLRDSVKQKVDEELSQIKQAVSKKGFLGLISEKSEAALTMNTWVNQSRTVLVSTSSVIRLQSGKDGTPADLKAGNYILVMGDADSENKLTAARLLVIPAPKDDTRTAIWGTVSKKTSSTLTLTTPQNDNPDIKLTSATKYAADTKLSDIEEGAKVLVLASTSTATPPVYTALVIYLYPSR